jgi:hypothetical protein
MDGRPWPPSASGGGCGSDGGLALASSSYGFAGRAGTASHLMMAFHLLKCYRNYERARVQMAIAENGLPNSPSALACTAYMPIFIAEKPVWRSRQDVLKGL